MEEEWENARDAVQEKVFDPINKAGRDLNEGFNNAVGNIGNAFSNAFEGLGRRKILQTDTLQEVFEWDGCTTEIPCSGCAERCGWMSADVPQPPFVDVTMEDRGVCDIPLLKIATDEVRRSVDTCPCLEKVAQFIELVGEDPSNADGASVATMADMMACNIENGFGDYISNYDDVVRGLGPDAILGAPIDMSMYIELAAAILTQGTTFKGTAQSYANDTLKAMARGIKDWLIRTVLAPLKPVEATIEKTTTEVEGLPGRFMTEADKCLTSLSDNINVDEVQKAIAEDLDKKVKQMKDLVSSIENVFTKDISDAYNAISSIAQCFENAADTLEIFDDGILRALFNPSKVKDAIEGLTSGEIAECARNLKSISGIPETIQSIQSLPGTVQSINNVVTEVEDGLNEKCGGLPATVRSLSSLASAGSTLEGALNDFRQIDIDPKFPKAKVASWQHSLNFGNIDLPCYEGMDVWEGGMDIPFVGFVGVTMDYPKFSRCSKDVKVPLPNGHIPYLVIG